MHDGRKVAVKVQHADIEEISKIDLEILGRVFALIQMLVRIRGMEEYPDDIAQMIREELDFRQEARNIETFTTNFAGNQDVRFPVVVKERSSQRVLTTEFVEGTKVTDFAELEAQGDRSRRARAAHSDGRLPDDLRRRRLSRRSASREHHRSPRRHVHDGGPRRRRAHGPGREGGRSDVLAGRHQARSGA